VTEPRTPIADYGLIASGESAALVSRRGSIDWLCLPRFDSPALFARLLGGREHGCWTLAPSDSDLSTEHQYRGETMILERRFETPTGAVRVLDFMPTGADATAVTRIVEGITGRVEMELDLRLRFDYGATPPETTVHGSRLIACTRADAVYLDSSVPLEISDATIDGRFAVSAGMRETFSLCWRPVHARPPEWQDAYDALTATSAYWLRWAASCSYAGEWRGPVVRALLTLKALTYGPTGALVAAPNLAPSRPRRRAQLGLPLQLATGRDDRLARLRQFRLFRRSEGMAGMALAHDRRITERASGDVHRPRPASAPGAASPVASGLRGLVTRADR
jgi:GH15 family glucan-1,4-alpha-glucosidase